MSAAVFTVDGYKSRWLAAARAAHGLNRDDQRVAAWLANRLQGGTTAIGTWSQMRKDLNLANHAAGIHLQALARAGLVGHRVRTGRDQGFALTIPEAARKSEAAEALNAKRVAARKRADALADAKWFNK